MIHSIWFIKAACNRKKTVSKRLRAYGGKIFYPYGVGTSQIFDKSSLILAFNNLKLCNRTQTNSFIDFLYKWDSLAYFSLCDDLPSWSTFFIFIWLICGGLLGFWSSYFVYVFFLLNEIFTLSLTYPSPMILNRNKSLIIFY